MIECDDRIKYHELGLCLSFSSQSGLKPLNTIEPHVADRAANKGGKIVPGRKSVVCKMVPKKIVDAALIVLGSLSLTDLDATFITPNDHPRIDANERIPL